MSLLSPAAPRAASLGPKGFTCKLIHDAFLMVIFLTFTILKPSEWQEKDKSGPTNDGKREGVGEAEQYDVVYSPY